MNRHNKLELIESLKDAMQNNQASFLVEYKGLDVATVMSLRQKLREQGASFKVAKVTLMRRAIDEVPGYEGLRGIVHDQVALVFSQAEPPVVAKLLQDFAKNNKALQIKGGCFESRVLTVEAVKELANLPSRDVLMAQICMGIQAPAAQLVNAIKGVMGQLVWTLDEIQKQKA
jgi:large subunit ribosomal protein L10